MIRVLLIDDNAKDLLMIQMMTAEIKGVSFEVISEKSLAPALDRLGKEKFDVILLSFLLKATDGLESLKKIQTQAPNIPVVILTGREDQTMASEAVRQGAQDYLVKGKLDPNLLSHVIQYAIERHQVMEEMRLKNQELQRLNALKSEFVSTVSHELRTPLTVVLSATNNLLDGAFGELAEPQKKWLKKISHHSMRLHEMISDLLDLSKLQSGKSEMHRERFDFGKLIKTTVANIQTIAAEKKLKLEHQVAGESEQIWGDAGRLEQVLTNLITNAIKFTPEGGRITVSMRQERDQIITTVADTGPGIAPQNQEMIFERFRQIRTDEDGTSSTKGIGLGLAICKEIVSQHMGEIRVESEVGKGSRFVFRLPVDARGSVKQSLQILVVDDEEEIGDLLNVTLTQAGHHVTVSRNGKHAIQLVQDPNSHFDFAFLDLMLPGATGVDVIKAIRATKAPTEVAILTAYPNSDLLFKGMATGPLTIIAKPFNSDQVLGVLEKLRPRKSVRAPQSKAA